MYYLYLRVRQDPRKAMLITMNNIQTSEFLCIAEYLCYKQLNYGGMSKKKYHAHAIN